MENINNSTQAIPVIVQKPKTNYLNLSLIFFAFILFITGAYFLGKQSTKVIKAPVAVLPKLTEIPLSPTPTINYNGKYKNEKLGFSFDYPQSYALTEVSPSTDDETYYISIMSPIDKINYKGPDLQKNQLKVEMWISPKPTTLTFNEYFDKQLKSIEEEPSGIGGKVTSTKSLTIGGYPAKYLSWQGVGTGITYYLMTDNRLVTIAKYPAETLLQSDFESILSTFKFVENKKTAIEVAKFCLDAYVTKDRENFKLCSQDDTNLDYSTYTRYKITSTKQDVDPNYYHVYINLYDKDNKIYGNNVNTSGLFEVLLRREEDAGWVPVSWDFSINDKAM